MSGDATDQYSLQGLSGRRLADAYVNTIQKIGVPGCAVITYESRDAKAKRYVTQRTIHADTRNIDVTGTPLLRMHIRR
jgi:hypothetical protein